MKCRTSDGLELYFEVGGGGTPCVYLHGGPGYWSNSFQQFAGELIEEKLQMIYLDQRGCGRSEHSLSKHYSLGRLIDDLEDLRIYLGIEAWYVMGHSFGGILAINYALRFPERAKGLILSNVTLHMRDSFAHQICKGAAILGLEAKPPSADNLDSFMESYYSLLTALLERGEYFKFQYVDLENKEKVDLIDQAELNRDPGFQQHVFSSEEYFQDYVTATADIHTPVLVIAGNQDHAVGPNHHESFRFPHAEVKVLDSGHHPYIENPLEFAEVVLEFVGEWSKLGVESTIKE